MTEELSPNAAKIVEGSLHRIQRPDQLDDIDMIVSKEVGELSLSLQGDAWDRTARLQHALIEIVGAYVRSKAKQKFRHKAT